MATFADKHCARTRHPRWRKSWSRLAEVFFKAQGIDRKEKTVHDRVPPRNRLAIWG
jgi:hypothetical protein